MKLLKKFSFLPLILLLPQVTEAQVMRSQIYEHFMKAQLLQKRGQDSAAIANLNEVANLVPDFPPTYLRQADIYNEMYQRNGSKEALSAAVFMYRKYLTLEFKEELIKEPSAKLRKLEDLMNVSHFEEEEAKDSQTASSEESIQIITDQASANAIASIAENEPELKSVELVSLVEKKAPTADITVTKETPKPSKLVPELGKPIFSYLSFYNTQLPTEPNTETVKAQELTVQNLIGHWVTEEMKADGRELWAFDIKADGPNQCIIQFSKYSGIVHETLDESTPFRRAVSLTKSYLKKTSFITNVISEVVNEQVIAKVRPDGISFSFEVDNQYKSGTALMSWGRNMMNNLQAVLPFGTAISNYVNNYMEQRQTADKAKSNTTVYTFTCRSLSDGILSCEISSLINSISQTGTARKKIGPVQRTSLVKTDGNYTIGQNENSYSSKDYGQWEQLFERVKGDAKLDVNYNYPLAILYYYGVGVKADTGKAIELMNALAAHSGDTRAKAWLSAYFYHKAYTDDTQNTFIRRKYLKSAQYWSKRMCDLKQKEWYGIKGDMCSSDQTRDIFNSLQDSAIYYYKLGDQAGDIHSTYRLGSLYLQGDKQNLPEAERLLLKAANAGNENAIVELSHIALLQNDLDAYLQNLHLAADLGCPEAYTELAKAYSVGPSRGFKLNPTEGMKMKRLAIRAEKDDWIPIILSFGYSIDPDLD